MREEDTVCVGSDGLQYCKACGEAKEAFFPKGDFMGMKKHSRQCACATLKLFLQITQASVTDRK